MKRSLWSLLSVCIILGNVGVSIAQTDAPFDPQELIKRVETQYNGDSSHAIMTMSIVTEDWSRELTMESWSEGREKFLTVIREPRKEEGTATLKIEDDIWNYLPRIDRLMKIPSSLMGDSWMGSHLTNDDLVKENKIDEMYTFTIESTADGITAIICTPKPDAAVVWGSIRYRVDLERLIPVDVEYYDEDEELMRTMTFDMIEQVSGRWIPLRMTVQPEDAPDEKTMITYSDLAFDVELADNLFTVQSLRRQ